MNSIPTSMIRWVAPCFLFLALAGGLSIDSVECAATASAQEPQWIWSSAQATDNVSLGTCYFRKTFEMAQPESGEVQITCDDSYELIVNGRSVGKGQNWKVLSVHDISKSLVTGRNTIAVKASNREGGTAGLAARVIVQSQGGTHVSHVTNASWKTSVKESPHWMQPQFRDREWQPATALGELGKTAPWDDQVQLASGAKSDRFQVAREFRIEAVVSPVDTGSLTTLTFNEFGHILAARELGPILIIRDTNKDGRPDTIATYSDEVKNCQGLLSLNGQLFVVGDGAEGAGFYRLADENGDGKPEKPQLLLAFEGNMAEHGPHAPVLGPDGLIYLMLGNHTKCKTAADAASPYRGYYEGDLLPRYEDASGHAAGIKAPGGAVVRTDTQGSFVELYAGGLRNAYDMAFNKHGDLLTVDSDMEWDVGLPWYRPTRVNHITSGSEFGWRSGWAVWPEYYLDSLPATVDLGRGSPTGMAVYNHLMFPARYHNALFVGDWSRGRILAVKMKPSGGSYVAESEVFVEGKPLNVTDLAVGPDGKLYFCTGGRGTEGGIYRVAWQGKVPATVTNLGRGVEAAIRQPQPDSSFARQSIALLKQKLGAEWDRQLLHVVETTTNKPEYRARGLELMQLFGPFPTKQLLVKISGDESPVLRTKTAYLMGIHADPSTNTRLIQLLKDQDSTVVRTACESLLRTGQKPSPALVLPLLASSDRHVSFAARRLLERLPTEAWKTQVLRNQNHRVFLQGATALVTAGGSPATAKEILTRASELMDGYMTDRDFLDLMRVVQLAVSSGKLTGDDIQVLRKKLADEYPSKNPQMNRELVRLLVYLQEPSIAGRFLEQLASSAPTVEKLHLALHGRFLKSWTSDQKFELLKFYEDARSLPGGHSFVGYIENVARDFCNELSEAEQSQLLAQGATLPNAALALLAEMPSELDAQTIAQLKELDGQLAGLEGDSIKRLGIGIVAVLGTSGQPDAMAYLREIFASDPDRRSYIAVGLAQNPDGENWPLLIQSLPVVDGPLAQEVLMKLATVDQIPDKPEAVRQVILIGLQLGNDGGEHAVALLEKWTGLKPTPADDTPEMALAAWQKWYAATFPEEPAPEMPVDSGDNKWTLDELQGYLDEQAAGDPTRGETVFAKAQCINCHRYGDHGEGIGPDLSTLSRRFQQKEILESILFPSHVISDQYAGKTITTTDGKTYSGLVSPAGDHAMVVLQTNGEKVTVITDEIDEVQPSKKSAMPEGLLNTLSLEEIADLFAYLGQTPSTSIGSRATRSE